MKIKQLSETGQEKGNRRKKERRESYEGRKIWAKERETKERVKTEEKIERFWRVSRRERKKETNEGDLQRVTAAKIWKEEKKVQKIWERERQKGRTKREFSDSLRE